MENNRLKFRAWDGIRMYEWLESEIIGEEGIFYFKSYESGNNSLTCYTKPWNDKSLIKIQFTGLRDKNGKEIYFGDIVKAPSGYLLEVFWHEEKMRIALKAEGTIFNFNVPLYEVVGNIFENPELLK